MSFQVDPLRNRIVTGNTLAGKLLLALSLLQPCYALGNEYLLNSSIKQVASYNDNILLQRTDESSAFGYNFAPNLGVEVHAEQWSYGLNLGLEFWQFDKTEFNTENQKLDFSSSYRTELQQWQLSAEFDRDSTRNTELTSSGRTDLDNRRELLAVYPVWSLTLDAVNQVQVSFGMQDVQYDTSQLNDYRYAWVGASWHHNLDQTAQTVLELQSTSYDSDATNNYQSDSIGMNVGITNAFSERFNATFMVGAWRSRVEYDLLVGPVIVGQNGNSSNGATLKVDLNYTFEASNFEFVMSRTLNPSGDGILNNTDEITLAYNKKFSELISGFIEFQRVRSTEVGDGTKVGVDRDRTYYRIHPGFYWRLTEQWRFNAFYTYRDQKYDRFNDRAESNTLGASINYQFSPKSFSR